MRFIVALLISFACAVAQAEPQVTVVLRVPDVVLDAPQKVLLGQAVSSVFDGANLSKARRYYVSRDALNQNAEKRMDVYADGIYDATMNEADYTILTIAKQAGAYSSRLGGNVTAPKAVPRRMLDAAQKTKQAAFVAGTFSGITISSVLDFTCLRTETPGEVKCGVNYVDVVPQSVYLDLIAQKSVVQALGVTPG